MSAPCLALIDFARTGIPLIRHVLLYDMSVLIKSALQVFFEAEAGREGICTPCASRNGLPMRQMTRMSFAWATAPNFPIMLEVTSAASRRSVGLPMSEENEKILKLRMTTAARRVMRQPLSHSYT